MKIIKSANRIKFSMAALVSSFLFLIFDLSIYTALTLFAAFIHECGHLIMMKLCVVPIDSFNLMPFGADIKRGTAVTSYISDIVISLGGIIANITTALIAKICFFGAYADFFVHFSLALAAFNALPVQTLDGGECLRAALSLFLSERSVNAILRILSFVFLLFLWGVATVALLLSKGNLSLFLITVYLFTSVFIA